VLGIPSLLAPLSQPGWRVLLYGLGWFSFNLMAIVYNIAQITYRQRVCPTELLGRMNAAVRWVVWGTLPLGALLGGSLATGVGLRATLWIGVAGAGLGGLFVFFSPLRRLRDLEYGADASFVRQVVGREQACDELAAAADADLSEEGFQVVLHGVDGDVQLGGDGTGRDPGDYPL